MLRIKGAFGFPRKRIFTWNIIPNVGEDAFLKMIARGDATIVAPGGNFYIGLTNNTNVGPTAVLADLTGEPPVANGYARKPITRDATGFPTVDSVNGISRAVSANVNFAAAGGDIGPFTRAFLTDASAGTVGTLFAISGELPEPVTIEDGNDEDVNYQLFLGYTG